MKKDKIKKLYNKYANSKRYLRKKNNYYHKQIKKLYQFLVPEDSKVLELGCSQGDLLKSLHPSNGTGIDISDKIIKKAREKFPKLDFEVSDVVNINLPEQKYDYIIGADLIGYLDDVYEMLTEVKQFCNKDTKLIFSFYSSLWELIIKAAEFLNIKLKQGEQNWISLNDMQNLLEINGYKVINKGMAVLCPIYIPVISTFLNRVVAKIPLIRNLCLSQYIVARKLTDKEEYSSSVIVPCLNEKGNIRELAERIPDFGKGIEIIFIDGASDDGTVEEIKKVIEEYPEKEIKLIYQGGRFGKNDAVIKGFKAASKDILMIQDSDITVDPETLVSFYEVISSGRGEFINGSRLVYSMENQAMRYLNKLGNKFFSIVFTYLLNQKVKDTLCGTKVFFKKDWEKIYKNRSYFGNFDPFGDFELLFGASKLNLDIVEMPVKYRARKYGNIKISRFKHGLLLIKMSFIALWKLKIKK